MKHPILRGYLCITKITLLFLLSITGSINLKAQPSNISTLGPNLVSFATESIHENYESRFSKWENWLNKWIEERKEAAYNFAPGDVAMITAVYDGPLSGGTPKGVEIFLLEDIADLSKLGIGAANNGDGSDGEEFTFPMISGNAGDYIYIASEATNFTSFFDFAPDYVSGSMSINGDDAIELFYNGLVIDVFGDINVDGNGEPWEYEDGWAFRNPGSAPAGSLFDINEWSFSGPNALDGETTNASATTPVPIVSYAPVNNTTKHTGHNTIQDGVDDAVANDVLNISDGTFNENVVLNKSIILKGYDPSNTIIEGTTGYGITIEVDDVEISDFKIQGFVQGIRITNGDHIVIDQIECANNSTYGINVNSGSIDDLTIKNSDFSGSSVGFKVGSSANITNLSVTDCAFHDNNQGFAWPNSSSSPTTIDGVLVKDCTFTNNLQKGLYIEKLSNAVFDNITVDMCGIDPGYGSNSAIDLNLKFNTFQSISLINSSITNSGITGTSSYPDGRPAISISVRDDGASYGGNPATLDGLIIQGNTFDVPNHIMSIGSIQGPANTVISLNDFSNLVPGKSAVINESAADILFEGNWHGVTNISDIKSTLSEASTGENLLASYSEDASFAMIVGVVTNVNNGLHYATIQSAIDDVLTLDGHTITVAAGTYSEPLMIDKELSILGPNSAISAVDGSRVAEAMLTENIRISAGSDVMINGFEFFGVSAISEWPIYIQGNTSGITINNNRFIECVYTAIKSGLTTTTANLTIEGNLIEGTSNDELQSGMVFGGVSGSISNNKISNPAYGGLLVDGANGLAIHGNIIENTPEQGLQLSGICSDVTVLANTINNANSKLKVDKGAIRLYGGAFSGLVTISENILSSSYNGIAIKDGEDLTGKEILIVNNSLEGNNNYAIYNGAALGAVEATCNWWGSIDQAIIQSKISGAVTASPYLTDGTDDLPADIGFQPTALACGGMFPILNITSEVFYSTIQEGIDAATSGDTLEIQLADYTEPGQITINKSLVIQGKGKTLTILRSNYNTASSGHGNVSSAWILTEPGTNVSIEKMTIDATGKDTYTALRFQDGGKVENVAFNEIKHSASPYIGIAVQVQDGNVDITGCIFTQIGRIGVHYRNGVIPGAVISGTYANNMYTGKGDGDWLDYALDISGGTTITVENNTISGNTGEASTDGSSSAGILVTSYFPTPANSAPNSVNILHNNITDNTTGIAVGYDGSDVSVVNATENNIIDNEYGISSTGPSVNATSNWWGDNLGPAGAGYGTGDTVSQNVLLCPWLDDAFDATPDPGMAVGPIHNISSGEYFCTIQEAVTAANAGNTIKIEVADFTEPSQIIIDKNLNLVGVDKASSTLRPGTDTGNAGDARAFILVNANVDFNLSNMTIDGTGKLVYQAIRNKGEGAVDNVQFTEIKYKESGPDYSGVAIAAFGTGPVDVSNSMFNEIGRIGILYFGTGVSTSTFSGNTYTGKGVGDWLDYGLDISAGAVVNVTNNTVTGNRGIASTDGSTSAGILVSTFFAPGTMATITGNQITNNSTGIAVGYDGSDVSEVTANDNNIYFNDFGVTTTAPMVDAMKNFWGDPDGPGGEGYGGGNPVNAMVETCLYYNVPIGSGTEELEGPIKNTNTGEFFCSVQDAIDDAETLAGHEITLPAGTFSEDININKGIVLKGANATIAGCDVRGEETIIEPETGGTTPITVSADGVTISGFTLTNSGGHYAVYNSEHGGFTFTNNIITQVGNNTESGNTHALFVNVNNASIDDINIANNKFRDIHAGIKDPAISNGSASAIFIGDSQAAGNITGLVISENCIDLVRAATIPFASASKGGKGAYGILLGYGGSGGGNVVDAQITNNDISDIEGLWAHAIGLEGNTPSADVLNNNIHTIIDHKSPSDAVAVLIEDNNDVADIMINNNSFTNVDLGVWNKMSGSVNASCNYWGSVDQSDIQNKINGGVTSSPYLTDGTDDNVDIGFQPTPIACGGMFPILNITTEVFYPSIQDGIDAAVAGDTLEIQLTDYTEPGQIVVTKDITLQGLGKTSTVLRPGFNTGNTGNARGFILVNAGIEFHLEKMTINGLGKLVWQAVRSTGSGSVDNVYFTNIKYQSSGSPYAGTAYAAFGTGNVDVSNCMFDEIGRIGMQYFGTGISGSNFTNNIYTGKGAGDWIDYMLDINAGAKVNIMGNIVSGNLGTALTDGSSSAGILVSTYSGLGTEAIISNNTISGNTIGVAVGFDAIDESVVIANNNNIFGNIYGFTASGSEVEIDASSNWWGDELGPSGEGPGIGDNVTENVNFCPWLDNAFDAVTPGVAIGPVHNTDSDEYFCTIQEAIEAATATNTIEIAEGTYNERVVVSKSLTIQGKTSDKELYIIDGTGLAGTGDGIFIDNNVTHVTLQNLTVQNFAGSSGTADAGIYAIGGNDNLTVDNVAILDNVGGSGFYANGPINDVTINGSMISGHTVGARGIVIWNGFKENINITNNSLSNNNCCGIELQDGTASNVNISYNTIAIGTGDNAIGVLGLNDNTGSNTINNNIITGGGRYGIEIKNPDGGITLHANNINLTNANSDLRDRAGIVVMRRDFTNGNPQGYADIPNGVTLTNNTVTNYKQSSSAEEGFGIVIEGSDHVVSGNVLTGNDVGIQLQGGGHTNANYVSNNSGSGSQNVGDSPAYFGRGNSPTVCNIDLGSNTFNLNGIDNRLSTNNYQSSTPFVEVDEAIIQEYLTKKINYTINSVTIENTNNDVVDTDEDVSLEVCDTDDNVVLSMISPDINNLAMWIDYEGTNLVTPPLDADFKVKTFNANHAALEKMSLRLADPTIPGMLTSVAYVYNDANDNGILDAFECVSDVIEVAITVNPVPVFTLSEGGNALSDGQTLTVCEGDPVALSLTGESTDVFDMVFNGASVGSGSIGSGFTYDFTAAISDAGTYDFTVTNSEGCVTTTSYTLNVKPTSSAEITADYAVWFNSTGNMASVPGSGDTYAWTLTNGTIIDDAVNPIEFYPSGNSDMELTVVVTNANNCSATSTTTIKVVEPCAPFDFSEAAELRASGEEGVGVWSIDRFKPELGKTPVEFVSQSTAPDATTNTLKHSITSNNGYPAGNNFYNTQGRRIAVHPSSLETEIDLFVPSDWATTGRRMAGFWGEAFNASNALSAYPILEFTSDSGTPRFRVFDNGTWADLGLPSGFVYDQWVTLRMKVLPDGEFRFTVSTLQGNLTYTSVNLSSFGSTHFENIILQGHNTELGVDYDIYWNNLVAIPVTYELTTNGNNIYHLDTVKFCEGENVTLFLTGNEMDLYSLTRDGNPVINGTIGMGINYNFGSVSYFAGEYKLVVTKVGGCTTEMTFIYEVGVFPVNELTVNALEILDGGSLTICEGETVNVSLTGAATDEFRMLHEGVEVGTGIVGAGTNYSFTAAISDDGMYTLEVTSKDGCISTMDYELVVTPLTAITIDPVASFCFFDGIMPLNATPSGGTFSGPGISGNDFDPALAGPGMHVITYTLISGDCTSTEELTIEVEPAVNRVMNNNDSGYGSFRSIIDSPCIGDTIYFDNALLNQTITLTSGEILIDSDKVLKGMGDDKLTISGNDLSRIFNVAPGVTFEIKGVKLMNGYAATNGGAILNNGNLILENVVLEGNHEDTTPKAFTNLGLNSKVIVKGDVIINK